MRTVIPIALNMVFRHTKVAMGYRVRSDTKSTGNKQQGKNDVNVCRTQIAAWLSRKRLPACPYSPWNMSSCKKYREQRREQSERD
ncbi:hypothetical protein TNCV_3085971 [Trichonephila clavipes]|nr:hypothetical protein TNCV_3085971 [Trichonephila clavipes]